MKVKIVKLTPSGVKDIFVKQGTCVEAATGEKLTVIVMLNFKTQPEILTDVTKVAVGYSHCVAIKNDELYGIGNNYRGQLGLSDVMTAHGWVYLKEPAIDVCTSMLTTCVKSPEGYIKVAGDFNKEIPAVGITKKFITLLDCEEHIKRIYKVA